MSRPPAPEIEFHPPDCPICGQELSAGHGGAADEFQCVDCCAAWSYNGEFLEWTDLAPEQCEATDWNPWSRVTHRCILSAGHDGDHQDGVVVGWHDGTPTPTGALP